MRLLSAVAVTILLMTSLVSADTEQWADDTLTFGIALYDTLGYDVNALDSVAVIVVDPGGNVHIAANKSAITWTGDSSSNLTNFKIKRRGTTIGTPNVVQDTTYIIRAQKSTVCTTATRFGTYQIIVEAHSSSGLSGGKWTRTVYPFVVGGVESRLSESGIRYLRDSLFFSRGVFGYQKASVAGVASVAANDSTQLLISHATFNADSTWVGTPVMFYSGAAGSSFNQRAIIRQQKRVSATQDSIWIWPGLKTGARPKTNDSLVLMFGFTGLYRQVVLGTDSGVNVDQWNGTAVATPATAGIPEVNVKNIDNDAASASGTVTFPNATIASTTNITAGTVTTATNVTTVNGLAANTVTASALATDAVQEIEAAVAQKVFATADTALRIDLIDGGANDTVLTRTGAAGSSNWSDPQRDSVLNAIADANTLLKNRLLRIKDTVDALMDTVQNTSSSLRVDTNTVWNTTQRDSILANLADANTQMKNRLLRIRDSVDNILDSIQLHDNWAAKEASVTIVRDTLALYDTRWDSLLAVVADANTLFKNRLLRIRDTVDNILDSIQLHDNWAAKEASVQIVRDTLALYDTRFDSLLAVVADANTRLKDRLLRMRDTVDVILDTLQSHDGWVAKEASTQIVRDTLALYDTRWDSTLAVLADANTKLKAKLVAITDTVNATIDTLQNGSSTLRVATVDTAAISKSIKERLFADTSKKIGFKGTAGDSVKVVGNIVVAVDSASIARSVWDDDITIQANRTVTATMTFDTTLLDKVRDTANAIIDTLQNLSSTLRLAGSDLDTVYQVVQCNDTMDGDFLLTLADYRAQIKHKMGIGQTNTTWLTDSVLNQLVREAIVTVNPIMRGYKTSITRVTQFDSSDYPIDSLVGISSVVWHKDDTARSITYLAREKWATLVSQHTYGASDPYLERPQVYDYTDNTISLFPVPTSEDTIQINGWSKIPNITVISAVSQIPQKYRVAVLKYASFLVARSKQHPLVQTFLDEYHESITFLMAGQNVQTDSK